MGILAHGRLVTTPASGRVDSRGATVYYFESNKRASGPFVSPPPFRAPAGHRSSQPMLPGGRVRDPLGAALALSALLMLLPPGAPVVAPSQVLVTDLRCEYRSNPLGIDEARPRLGWILRSERRNEAQAAYQVIVASSEAALARDRGDLWDSGKVASNESVHVVYGGAPLRSRAACHWKVRVWDREGRASPWSAPARWEMALLDQTDWTAAWVNDGKPTPTSDEAFYRDDPAPLFRHEFTLAAPVTRARLYVTGLGYYEAFVNGTRVGDQVLDPGWTMYGKRVFYSTYDITLALRPGRNCLGAMLGNGWYNPLPLRMWGNLNLRQHLAIGRPRLIAQLEIEMADGSRQSIVSDPSWRVADGPIVSNNVYLGEVYDARREIAGWNLPGYDDRAWRHAAPSVEPVGALRAQPQPPIRVTAEIRPVGVTEPSRGVFIVDMGQNFAGWAELAVAAPAGTRITLRYGERLNADGTLNPLTSVAGQVKGRRTTKDGVSRKIGGEGSPEVAWQSDVYVASGRGRETYRPRFTFHGFRYVEVDGLPGRPTLDAVRGLRLNADVEEVGSFSSSNDLLNRVQEMTRRTFLSNLFSVQSDCPHREKFGYGGDIVATSDALMLNLDMARFYEKAVVDWADSARDDGMLTDTAPFVGIQYCGVGWAMAHPVLQAGLYQYYGDRRIVERQYGVSRRWLDLVTAATPDGIVKEGLGDHEALTETPAEALVTPMYYAGARLVARLAGLLERRDEAARYSALAESIRRAYATRVPKPGADHSPAATESAQAFALQAGLLDAPDRAASVRWLLDDIRGAQTGHLTTGIFGTKFALNVLSAEGHAQDVFDVVRQETYPGWGYMLANGATTLWEHWALSDNTYSHNHPMFGSVSQWFFNWLGGIQPSADAAGFDRIVIRPQLVNGLAWVRCSYRSVRGPVVVNWSSTGGRVDWQITIPVNATASIFIPAGRLDEVEEGREVRVPARRAEGVRDARMEGANAVFIVGSGTYRFVSTPAAPPGR
jgi:alpha-L-rhamnosidase